MIASVGEAIRAHALEAVPEEACGYVARDPRTRSLEVVRARNVHPEPMEHGAIDPAAYLEAKSNGRSIEAFYHSHVDTPAEPGELDQSACNVMGLRSIIYSVQTNRFLVLEPEPPWAPLLGLPWSWEEGAHCFEFVRRYYKLIRSVDLPEFDAPALEDFPPSTNLFFDHAAAWGFKTFDKTIPIMPHDVVSFRFASEFENHLAVYVGNSRIVHHRREERSRAEDLDGAHCRRIAWVYRYRGVQS